jgi:GTP-binding protein
MKEEGGALLEPWEELTVDVDDQYVGAVIEKLGSRKGQLVSMDQRAGMTRLVFKIPTRGLLGYRSEFMTDTKGMGVMNYFSNTVPMRENSAPAPAG